MDKRKIYRSALEEQIQIDLSLESARNRSLPIYYNDVARKNPITILEEYVMQWEPCDLRLDPLYLEGHEVEITDDLLTQDIAKGMKLQVEERIPSKNTIKVAVLFQHNMSEFERYNDVVDSHNEQWLDQGCPEDVFNPETGDIFEVEDRYLNHAGDNTPNPFGQSTGHLASLKPMAKRRKYLTVTYKLNLFPDNQMFSLEFSAEDYQGQVVYYNTLRGKNLSKLTRQATQELYGNPEAYGNSGPFYEGISMLVTGKKLKRCSQKNEKPTYLIDEACLKNPVIQQASLAAGTTGLRTLGNLIRYIIPIVGLFSILIRTFTALSNASLDGLLLSYLISLGMIYASVLVSGWLINKAYELDVERRFS